MPFKAIRDRNIEKRCHKTILQNMVFMCQVMGVGGCPACHSTKLCQSRCQLRELSSIVMVTQTSPANATMIVDSWSLRGCAVFHLETHGEEAIPAKTLEPPTANQTAFANEVVLCSLFPFMTL